MSFDGITDLSRYSVTYGGKPLFIRSISPTVTVMDSGISASLVSTDPETVSSVLRLEVPVDPAHSGYFIEILTGVNVGVYKITDVVAGDAVLNAIFSIDPDDGNIEWRLLGGAVGVVFSTEKLRDSEVYFVEVSGLRTNSGLNFGGEGSFTALGVDLPRVTGASLLGDGGGVLVEFDQEMGTNSGSLGDYSITGPSIVIIKKVWFNSPTSIGIETIGLTDGLYEVFVSTAGTPGDLAGNPVDLIFSSAPFMASVPVSARSIFTDKGPIAKPYLVIQAGVAAVIEAYNEVLLPGANLGVEHIGKYVTLLGGSINGGTFRITSVLSTIQVRVQASFTLPDPDSGSLIWEVVDFRNGQIADEPSDVEVRINGLSVVPEAVIGLLGQIVLPIKPEPSDSVHVDYSWISNPTVDICRLNSKEFRLNSWNRDVVGKSRSYRYNNVLVKPENFEPLDIQSTLGQPLEREVHYRAFERAYTPVFNDPSSLLLNSPTHRIAFIPSQRFLTEEYTAYEAISLPEDSSPVWLRRGAGSASCLAGVLKVVDDSSGLFPNGQPLFWTRPVDLTFPHAFALSWRFFVESLPSMEGVFTGIVAGYSNEIHSVVIGFLLDGGVRKIGILRDSDNPSDIASWAGGLDSLGNPTGLPVELDWSILRSYRLFRDPSGYVKLYVDGNVVEILRAGESDLPFLKGINSPFDSLQGVFFGSVSRPASSETDWDFVRYLVLPVNPVQISHSSFVSYDGSVKPEVNPRPWTPVGYHGTETLLPDQSLLLDSTSATDPITSNNAGLVGGDFRGFIRLEPLLTVSSQIVIDAAVHLRSYTHGVNPNGLTIAVDDGNRLMQLSLLSLAPAPKLSYGGRSLPDEFSPYVWSSLGGATVEMVGRELRITDDSSVDGKVYYIEDNNPLASVDRVVSASLDYALEFRNKVESYTGDPQGFVGAFGQIFDGQRSVGLMLLDIVGVKHVAFHSDGVAVGAPIEFNWGVGDYHTYKLVKSTAGDLVSLFADGAYLGSEAYSAFSLPAPDTVGVVSFGSSTPSSMESESVVDWAYCNAWRINIPKPYVGLWKGADSGSLLGFHLPLKASGREASVVNFTLYDPQADFSTVSPGDPLIVDSGSNRGVYQVQSVISNTELSILGSWPHNPSSVGYRIPVETDWSFERKYRISRDPTGKVSIFIDAEPEPLIQVGYNSMDLPASAAGVFSTLSGGLPSIAFGAFDPANLSQSSWDYVNYGVSKPSSGLIVPHHEVLNQWNVMQSPERLFTNLPHELTDFKSSSTGITGKKDPDFLENPDLRAYTILNQDTPSVPKTQSFEVRAPFTIQEFVASLSTPEDVLEHPQDFSLNDGAIRFLLDVPDDVLYSALDTIEQSTGEMWLLTPMDDDCGWSIDGFSYKGNHCLTYDASTLPEDDSAAPTPWVRVSDDPSQVSASVAGGILTYGTGPASTRSVYLNNTPLPDHTSLRTEVKFRLKLAQDATLGTGDSQVRFGLSSPNFTVALAFVTTPSLERFVRVLDLNNGNILGAVSFDFLDGSYHTYRIVRDGSRGVVQIFVDN